MPAKKKAKKPVKKKKATPAQKHEKLCCGGISELAEEVEEEPGQILEEKF